MAEPEGKANDRALLRRIIGLFAPYRSEVLGIALAVLVGVTLGILPPFLLQRVIDFGIQAGDLGVVAQFSVFTVLAVLAGAGVTLLYGYWSVVVGQKIMCDLRERLFTHLQGMSLRFFTATRTGDIQTRLINDVAGVQTVVSNTITDQLSNVAIVATTVVAMFVLDWRLSLLSIAMVPFFAFFGRYVGEFSRKVRQGMQEQTSELNSMMQEQLSVSGILLSKTIADQGLLHDKFDKENKELARWQIKSSVVQYLFFALIRLITQLAPALVFWLAGWLLIAQGDSNITVGKLVAFTGLQARLFFPLTGLLSAQVEIISSFALFQRIFEYLDMPHDVQDAPDAIPLTVTCAHAKTNGELGVRGRVEFRDVEFRYEPTQAEPTLSGINFVAEPGQLVALVGPSGAGKTTLTYLIPRLYDPDQGQVLIDGHDLRKVKLESVHRLVGTVTQETYLVHTTIRENLRMARPQATDEELVDACKSAAIHEHIASLPEGYDTVVGERGYKLSGGEKQRLAIARAILKDPRVLILDEATSALDTASERVVQASLAELMKGRTTFAIAHRLSTILAADQILALQDGRIVERGTHAELLAKGGLYRKLYDEQFRGEATEAHV
ncbi:MAG: ABC transporter ATP-binding protein [Fimbriimonadaceae bacterium]|nr:ABC transporter ATP-binding protein [Fimbriimonadaceae bacterium]QYK56121.1 MAG: ABC transporter ATP-binding protein [Fimbriimonadaceae bacterium]